MHNYHQEKKEETINYTSKEFNSNDELIGVWKYILDSKTKIILSINRIV